MMRKKKFLKATIVDEFVDEVRNEQSHLEINAMIVQNYDEISLKIKIKKTLNLF